VGCIGDPLFVVAMVLVLLVLLGDQRNCGGEWRGFAKVTHLRLGEARRRDLGGF
jgi:hypothetical protein